MQTIDFMAGTHISAAAVQLVEAAKAHGSARAKFNDIELIADADISPEAIIDQFDRDSAARAQAYRQSPEGVAAAKASTDEIEGLQAEADKLVGRLADLDFADQGAVLTWLGELQPCSDRIGVKVDGQLVLAAFATHDLTPDMCVGPAFNGDDCDVFYRWLVGQALDGLERGPAIHGIFHKFAAEWRDRFDALNEKD